MRDFLLSDTEGSFIPRQDDRAYFYSHLLPPLSPIQQAAPALPAALAAPGMHVGEAALRVLSLLSRFGLTLSLTAIVCY
jgi:hypothetical protein